MCTTIKVKDEPIVATKPVRCWKILRWNNERKLEGVYSRFEYLRGFIYTSRDWKAQLLEAKNMHATYKRYNENRDWQGDLEVTNNMNIPLPASETTMDRGGFHSFLTEKDARYFFSKERYWKKSEYALALCEIPAGAEYLRGSYPSGRNPRTDAVIEFPSYLSQGMKVLKVKAWKKPVKK